MERKKNEKKRGGGENREGRGRIKKKKGNRYKDKAFSRRQFE